MMKEMVKIHLLGTYAYITFNFQFQLSNLMDDIYYKRKI